MEMAALFLTVLKNSTFSLGPMATFIANPLLLAHGGPPYPKQIGVSPHMAQKVTATPGPAQRYTRADRERHLFNPAVYEDTRGLIDSSSFVIEAEAQGAGLSRPAPQQ
jgi:hypothetical protein